MFNNLFNRTKKGFISGPLGTGIMSLFSLFLAGILVFTFALAGGEMQNATTDATAIDVINQTVAGAQAWANFSPTLWIMVAIGMLLLIIVSSFAIFLVRKS